MSLILEALRKSEAERRRGQTPDLLSDVAPAAPSALPSTRNRGVTIAVVAASATALLVAWWLRPGATPEPGSLAAAEPVASQGALPSPSASTPTQSQASPPLRAAAVSTSPAAASRPAPRPPAPAAAPEPELPAPTTTQADSRPSPVAGPAPAPMPPPAQVAIAEPPAATAPAFTSPDMPLRLSDLTSEERQQLPALKVSMHMWAPDPANRFAIIDGTRVNEGDRVGEATIEAIQNDSVMLSWHGRRIRLPIR